MAKASRIMGRLSLAAALPLFVAFGGKAQASLIAVSAVAAVGVVIAAELIERHERRAEDNRASVGGMARSG